MQSGVGSLKLSAIKPKQRPLEKDPEITLLIPVDARILPV